MNITDKQADFVAEITQLRKHGLRAKSDLRNEKILLKIREHTLEHVPYLLVVGDREVESVPSLIRTQDGIDSASCSVTKYIAFMHAEIARKGRTETE